MTSRRDVNGMWYGVDPDNEPGRRTKLTHPYSYDPITQFVDSSVKGCGTIYTDRLLQWDFDKHDRLCEKYFGNRGQHWDTREPKKIEAFLRDWLDDQNVRLAMVMEYCNVATGYPTWRLDYGTTESTTTA